MCWQMNEPKNPESGFVAVRATDLIRLIDNHAEDIRTRREAAQEKWLAEHHTKKFWFFSWKTLVTRCYIGFDNFDEAYDWRQKNATFQEGVNLYLDCRRDGCFLEVSEDMFRLYDAAKNAVKLNGENAKIYVGSKIFSKLSVD